MALRKDQAGIAAILAITGVAAAVLAGCSSGSTTTASASASAASAAAPTVTVTVTASAGAPSAVPPPAGSSTAPPPASSPAGSAPGGSPACSSASLQVSVGSSEGTAGSVYEYIEFKNVSASACTMYGFPGVSLRGGTPSRQIGAAATRAPNDNPSLVALTPGGMAAALMRRVDAGVYSDSTCKPTASATLQVYPPNQTVPQEVPYVATGCAASSVQLLQVNAVQPGAGDPQDAS